MTGGAGRVHDDSFIDCDNVTIIGRGTEGYRGNCDRSFGLGREICASQKNEGKGRGAGECAIEVFLQKGPTDAEAISLELTACRYGPVAWGKSSRRRHLGTQ